MKKNLKIAHFGPFSILQRKIFDTIEAPSAPIAQLVEQLICNQ